MSWYFLGGFSAYLSVPSGRCWNHSGCSVSHGWSADAFSARSKQTSMPCVLAVLQRLTTSAWVPSSGWTASWPPSSAPIAYGEPGSSGPAVRLLLRPLRLLRPIGWMGSRYRTSKPRSAISGISFSVAFRPPQERGNSSYQAPKRAFTRSTSSGSGFSSVVLPWRCWIASIASNSSLPSAASYFAWGVAVGSWRTSSASLTAGCLEPLLCSSTTPSDSSPDRSSPRLASTLRRSSSCQVANTSDHASIVNCHVPVVSTVKLPPHLTPLTCGSRWVIGASSQRRPPAALYLTTARSFSWPSRKMSA